MQNWNSNFVPFIVIFCKKSQIAANVFEKLCREEDDDESLVMVAMPLKVWRKYEEYKKKGKDK